MKQIGNSQLALYKIQYVFFFCITKAYVVRKTRHIPIKSGSCLRFYDIRGDKSTKIKDHKLNSLLDQTLELVGLQFFGGEGASLRNMTDLIPSLNRRISNFLFAFLERVQN